MIRIYTILLAFLVNSFIVPLCFSKNISAFSGKCKDYNVVLIIVDSLRPDYLGCYGYGKNVSPNIDALAKKSIVFNNAFCQIPLTLPSKVSIFTSLYPESHGTIQVFKDSVPENVYTLAQILKTYGYQTAWFGSLLDPHSGAGKGVLRGFDTSQYDTRTYDYDLRKIVDFSFYNVFQWLRQHNKRPIFLVVHNFMTHITSFPFSDFRNKFSKKVTAAYKEWQTQAIALSKQEVYSETIEDKEGISGNTAEEVRIRFDHKYKQEFKKKILKLDKKMFNEFLLYLDSSIFEMDKLLIGLLIEELQKNNLTKKTIVIITAAHGDEYGEHGHLSHALYLYDESIRVPLIFYIPGLGKPKNIDALVQSIDILPTTLDLLGIPLSHQAQGVSLVSLIYGKKQTFSRQQVFSQSVDGKYMIRTREWKFIDNSNVNMQHELYNLKDDSKEQKNVILENPDIAKNLEEQLLKWRRSLPIYADNSKQPFGPGIDKETQERIKKTGYW